jgi:hypothetical protein
MSKVSISSCVHVTKSFEQEGYYALCCSRTQFLSKIKISLGAFNASYYDKSAVPILILYYAVSVVESRLLFQRLD